MAIHHSRAACSPPRHFQLYTCNKFEVQLQLCASSEQFPRFLLQRGTRRQGIFFWCNRGLHRTCCPTSDKLYTSSNLKCSTRSAPFRNIKFSDAFRFSVTYFPGPAGFFSHEPFCGTYITLLPRTVLIAFCGNPTSASNKVGIVWVLIVMFKVCCAWFKRHS